MQLAKYRMYTCQCNKYLHHEHARDLINTADRSSMPPPDLPDDATSEILLRLPPHEPQWLFRAALVCKPWLRILSDPAFLRRYRDFHGNPPLLGLVDGEVTIESLCFVPTTALQLHAFPVPEFGDARFVWALDCRHGRVLFEMFAGMGIAGSQSYFLVCDPVTGDRHRVPDPKIQDWWVTFRSAVVFCAAAGCDHLDCHGGPFCLVCLCCDRKSSTMLAAMYSSEIGAWSAPVELYNVHHVPYSRGPLLGDEIYFAPGKAATIIKYDWVNNSLSVINPPPPAMHDGFTLMVMEDHSLGLAGIEDSTLHLWSRRVSSQGIAEWVQCRVIDLEKSMPMANPRESASVAGFAEGVGVIFISTGVGLFMLEIKSGRVRKVDNPAGDFSIVLPYMSFYTPDRLLGAPADL